MRMLFEYFIQGKDFEIFGNSFLIMCIFFYSFKTKYSETNKKQKEIELIINQKKYKNEIR